MSTRDMNLVGVYLQLVGPGCSKLESESTRTKVNLHFGTKAVLGQFYPA